MEEFPHLAGFQYLKDISLPKYSPRKIVKQIINQKINDIKRRGKWLVFELDDYFLLSHLRMEGRYFIRNKNDEVLKHEHISFVLDNNYYSFSMSFSFSNYCIIIR